MKLISAVILNQTLGQISAASESTPRDFTVLVKLVVAENMRLSNPHAQDYEKLRVDLIKQYGEEDGPEKWTIKPESPNMAEFMSEMKKLSDSEVNTKFRRIYEKELKDAPLTIAQISVLQEAGIIVPNE